MAERQAAIVNSAGKTLVTNNITIVTDAGSLSIGVSAAYLWSLYALFFGDAGMTGMTMGFELIPSRDTASAHIYLEVAAAVTTLILLGRFLEARAKSRSGAALRALLGMGAKDVSLLRDGTIQFEQRLEAAIVSHLKYIS